MMEKIKNTFNNVKTRLASKSGMVNDLINIGLGFIVFIVIVAIGLFIAYQVYTALPINNTSIFYYGSTVSTWLPIVLLFLFLGFMVLVAALILFALMKIRGGAQ